jgi:flagellar biosynthesis chaperone FliJ
MCNREEMLIQAVKSIAKGPLGALTDWEQQFISNMEERIAKYGAKTSFSTKQEEVINRIWEKSTDERAR